MSTRGTDPGEGGSDARRAALHTLDPLVGTWAVQSAGSSGTVRYSWFEGDAFLVQEVDLVADGDVTRGVEYIGWDPESATLRSHYFAGSGEILEYTYDLTGATLTIWFGGPDSPAKFVGDFDAAFQQNTGAWEWPGGGYASTMRRIEEAAS